MLTTLLRAAALTLLVACSPSADRPGRGDDPTDPSGTGPGGSTNPTTTPSSAGDPTWYGDIAPLFADRCSACHAPGGSAPFSLATYEDARPWGPAAAASIADGRMPPFYASAGDEVCDMPLGMYDDIRLSEAEKQLVYDWVEADMPEGDPATAAPAPGRPVEALDRVDLELELQEPYVVDGTDDVYQCFRIPLPNTQTMYLQGIEVVPGNDLVVHHALVWNDPRDSSASQVGPDGSYRCSGFPDIFPTELISTWTPGTQPVYAPEGTATPLEPGASIVLNVHYHPTGTTSEVDRTRLRLKWTTEEPEMFASWFLVDTPFGATVQPGPNDTNGTEFRIPPNVPDHLETVQMWFTSLLFSADMTVFAITPHMHYLGTDMLVEIVHNDANDDKECLVHAPGFRFDFQRGYVYDPATGELPVIHRGDRVRVTCRYDNSESNPFLPLHLQASGATEPHDVWWGEETGDEMCMAIVGLIVPKDGWSPFSWL
ncbi:MAG: hypothetical protein R3F59_13640 [Myxococcota bacterium]